MKSVLKIVKTYFFYLTSALGASLAIKANIGVSSFNSMNVAISSIAETKIGTITILINLLFLFGYMSLTHYKKKLTYAVQLLTILLFGALINFFTYQLLNNISIQHYLMQVAFISFGTILSGLSIGMIVHYDVIALPVEGCCLEISKHSSLSFSKLRYSIDLFSVIISIIISYSFKFPFFVREGTLISMILLTASMTLITRLVTLRPKTA